jgi:peptidyl-prolyl cis-trans isomerase D
MSILESIRNRAGVLVVVFVGLALLAFTISGALETGFSFLGGGNDRDFLAEMNGHRIKATEFSNDIQKIETSYMQQTGQSNIDPQMHENVITEIWNRNLSQHVYEPQYKKVGINVTPAELSDMLWGRNISSQILQAPIFQDTITRQFKPELVHKYVEALNEDDEKAALQYEQWVDFEEGLIKDRKRQKYLAIISKGFYVTTAEAKRKFDLQNKNAVVKYVVKKFDTVADSTITVTEDDIKKAYEENKYRFRLKQEVRKIDVVTFGIVPSQKDIDGARKTIEGLIPNFKTATNDTSFAVGNSDNKGNPFTSLIKGQTTSAYDSAVYASPAGTVLGPYLENTSYKIIKVSRKSDSLQVKARHILFNKQKYTNDQARSLADSVRKAIKGGTTDFVTMAATYGSDGTAQKGGDLGFFSRTQMVKPFADAAFGGSVGDIQIVETDFGIHLLEVQQKEYPVIIVSIEKQINPGKETIDAAYVKATEFAGNNTTAEAFDKSAKTQNIQVRPYFLREGEKDLSGLKGSREIVIWANDNAEKGDVSKAYQIDDQYVIACLKEVRSKGIPPLEEVKKDAEMLAKQAKKAQKFVTELTSATTGSASIDQVATKAKATVESTTMPFNAVFIPGAGRELGLIGAISTQKPGVIAKPFIGQSGVYVAVVESIADLQPAANVDMKLIKKQFLTDYSSRAFSDAVNVLEYKAEIVDKRYRGF